MKSHHRTTARGPLARRLGVLFAAVALGVATGCADGASPAGGASGPTEETEPSGDTGSISLALTAPGGATFSSFDFVITGPSFVKAGSIDVSQSSTVSAVIDGLPAAPAYSLTLTGSSTSPVEATCSGSAAFSIAAGALTSVPISVSCHVTEEPNVAAVPIPRSAPAFLGLALFALGTLVAGRRRHVA